MTIQNVIPPLGSTERPAYDAAVSDILMENPQNIKIDQQIAVLLPSPISPNCSLTYLSGKNGFIPSELNTGEGFIRKVFNN